MALIHFTFYYQLLLLLLCIFVFFVLAILNILLLNPNKSLDLFSLFADFPVYIVKSMDFRGKSSIFQS